jgi:putative nucleotidyltransferase with HDIG domain
MREELLRLIPEFDLIKDPVLREKTLQVWVAAMARGSWTPKALCEMPFTLLINPCPASYVEHVRAVTLTALHAADVFAEIYGSRVPINRDYLIAGGLLHDIGKLLEYEPGDDGMTVQTRYGKLIRHPFSGTALAAEIGLPEDVLHMIAAHAGEGEKVQRTPEATLINKADFMSFESLRDLQSRKHLRARLEG